MISNTKNTIQKRSSSKSNKNRKKSSSKSPHNSYNNQQNDKKFLNKIYKFKIISRNKSSPTTKSPINQNFSPDKSYRSYTQTISNQNEIKKSKPLSPIKIKKNYISSPLKKKQYIPKPNYTYTKKKLFTKKTTTTRISTNILKKTKNIQITKRITNTKNSNSNSLTNINNTKNTTLN